MGRSEARIYTRIWDPEDDFIALDAGPQRMYLLLLSQPGLSLCGVIDYTPKRWATLAANTNLRSTRRDLDALEHARKVVIDTASEELWIRSYLKNDPGVFKSPNLLVGVANAYVAVSSPVIREWLAEQVAKGVVEGFPKGLDKGLSGRLPEPFLNVLRDGFREGPNAGARAGVVLGSSSGSVSATPGEGVPPESGSGPCTGVANDESETRESKTQDPGGGADFDGETLGLARFWLEALDQSGWSERKRDRELTDARRVISEFQAVLDDRPIEEAIGRCREAGERPKGVGYLRSALVRVAAEQGVEVPEP